MSELLNRELKRILQKLHNKADLSGEECGTVFNALFDGLVNPILAAGILSSLATKGETAHEISMAATCLRLSGTGFHVPSSLLGKAIDTCGTGGDNANTFNISTTVAILTASCGVLVAKHGNRAASSKSGSADMLEALGVKIDINKEKFITCLNEANIGFLFAPKYYQTMANVAPIRKELGARTIFNLIGPLANPIMVQRQLLGVYAAKWVRPMAEALQNMFIETAMVVHGGAVDGQLDELCLDGENTISLCRHDKIIDTKIKAESLGLESASLSTLGGGAPYENAEITKNILIGQEHGPKRDVVLLNTAAALIVGDAVDTTQDIGYQFKEGIEIAAKAIDSGKAAKTLETLIQVSNGK